MQDSKIINGERWIILAVIRYRVVNTQTNQEIAIFETEEEAIKYLESCANGQFI